MRSRLLLAGVETDRRRQRLARVDAEEGELPDERVGHDLERPGRRTARCRSACGDDRLVRRAGSMPFDRRHVQRRRQVVDHRVQQRLHALVLEARAAEHRCIRSPRWWPCAARG